MRHQHRFWPAAHAVEHLGLARQVPDALVRQLGIRAVQQHELGWVEGQADVQLARLPAEGG
jgi:hypothetical protein